MAPRVVVAGGHSAGHIEPTMNFADALRRLEPTAEITALGTVGFGGYVAAALRATGVQVLHITGPQNVVEVPGRAAIPPSVICQCAVARRVVAP
jgi:UDP-N-acetylglucosamine:LPS N-acetylglucosamine transferase